MTDNRPLKVFGGCMDGRNRLIVAAKSHTAAIKLWQEAGSFMSAGYVRKFSCETFNPDELKIALAAPGEVFSSPVQYPHVYKRISLS